jgi:outer membrane immunogenic protein
MSPRARFHIAAFVLATTIFMPSASAQQPQQTPPPPPPPASAYNWSGFYGGGNIGGVFGRADFLSGLGRGVPFFEGEFYENSDPIVTSRIIDAYRSNDVDIRSLSGGLQVGYNAWMGGLLVGIEADINFFKGKKSKTTSALGDDFPGLGTATYTFTNEIDANYIASLRPRIGVLAGDVLLYATGGVAMTTLKYEHHFTGAGGGFSPPDGATIFEDASVSETRFGWTAGGGLEIPIGPNVTLKAEYLVTDFGSVSTHDNKIQHLTDDPSVDFPCGHPDTGLGNGNPYPVPNPTPRQCFDHKADLLLHSLRLGINIKF